MTHLLYFMDLKGDGRGLFWSNIREFAWWD